MALANTQKNDKSGGFFIVQARSAAKRIEHRLRFHVPDFATTAATTAGIAPYDRAYAAPVAGHEPSIAATFYELVICLRGMYDSSFHFTLVGLYQNSATGSSYTSPGPGGGTLAPVHPIPQCLSLHGTSGGTAEWLPGLVTLYLSTLDGGRFFVKMISSQEWDPNSSKDVVQPVPGGLLGGGSPIEILTAYLQGGHSGVLATGDPEITAPRFGGGYQTGNVSTMLVGHDGSQLVGPTTKTNTMYKRTRRSLRLT